MIYVIAYDSPDPARADAVDRWVRSNIESWTHPMRGIWLVDAPLVAEQIDTALAPLIGPSDRLIIAKGGTEAMWRGISEDAAQWISLYFPGSLSERIPGKTEGILE
jgi:hypothetical protein